MRKEQSVPSAADQEKFVIVYSPMAHVIKKKVSARAGCDSHHVRMIGGGFLTLSSFASMNFLTATLSKVGTQRVLIACESGEFA